MAYILDLSSCTFLMGVVCGKARHRVSGRQPVPSDAGVRASGADPGPRQAPGPPIPNPAPADHAVPDPDRAASSSSPGTERYGARLLRELRAGGDHDALLSPEDAERLARAESREEAVALLQRCGGRGPHGDAPDVWPQNAVDSDHGVDGEGPGRLSALLPLLVWLLGIVLLAAAS